jgi:hypothetical protein
MDVYSRSRVLPPYNGAYQLPQVLKTVNPCIIETPKDGGNPRIGANGSPQGFMKSMHKHKFSPKGKHKMGGGAAPMNNTFHSRHQTITESTSQMKLLKLPSGLQTPSKQLISR